ncbi:MAG: hypothetical protein ACXWEY_00245 [Bacteroidia bacterium]
MAVILTACKKEPNKPEEVPTYTIQGRILDGATMRAYPNLPVEIVVTKGAGSRHKSQNLGTAVSNDTGWFSITYKQTSITGTSYDGDEYNAQIRLLAQWHQFEEIPVNQNVTKDFFQPTKGTLKVFLKTEKPLETNNDTLLFAYPIFTNSSWPDHWFMDTITKSINGYYLTLEDVPLTQNLFIGRGSKNFVFSQQQNAFKYVEQQLNPKIDGDPIVNEITINY